MGNQDKLSKKIEVGKFYLIHDGSNTGHPGLVVWKDDDINRYLVIRIDSDKIGESTKKERGVRHITKLKYPTSSNVVNSYIKNRPTMCKRKDINPKELADIKINIEDMQLITLVKNRNPEYSRSFKKNKK